MWRADAAVGDGVTGPQPGRARGGGDQRRTAAAVRNGGGGGYQPVWVSAPGGGRRAVMARDVFFWWCYDAVFRVAAGPETPKTLVDVRHLALHAHNAVHRRGSCRASVRLRWPPSTCQVFASGRMSVKCTAVDVRLARVACRRFARLVQRHGRVPRPDRVRVSEYRLNAARGFVDTGRAVDLRRLWDEYRAGAGPGCGRGISAYYEPELTCGECTLRVPAACADVRVFATGTVSFVCTGDDPAGNLVKAALVVVPAVRRHGRAGPPPAAPKPSSR